MGRYKQPLKILLDPSIINPNWLSTYPEYFESDAINTFFVLDIVVTNYTPIWEKTKPQYRDGFTRSTLIPNNQRYGFNVLLREGYLIKYEVLQAIINFSYSTPGQFKEVIIQDFLNPETPFQPFITRRGKLCELKAESGVVDICGNIPVNTGITFSFYETQLRKA